MNNPFILSDDQLKTLLNSYSIWCEKDEKEKKYPKVFREKANELKKTLLNRTYLTNTSDKDLVQSILDYSKTIEGPVIIKLVSSRISEQLEKIKRNLLYFIETSDDPFVKAHKILEGEYKIPIFAKAFWTPLFQAQYQDKLPNWNNKTEKFFKKVGINLKTGKIPTEEKYRILSNGFSYLKQLDSRKDFYDLNHLMHYGAGTEEGIKLIDKLINSLTSYWQIAPAEGARLWDEFRDQRIAAVGYSQLNMDLTEKTEKEVRDLYSKHYPEKNKREVDIKFKMLWDFISLKPGSKIVTNKGRSSLLGLGVVKSGYKFRPERKEYKHTVDVNYYRVSDSEITIPKNLKGKFGKTIVALTKSEFETIEELFPSHNGPELTWKETKDSLNLSNLGQDFIIHNLHLENEDQIKNQVRIALKNNKNIILIGPPGTGKSKLASDICEYYCGLDNYIMTTATSDWSTFETIGGYRPDKEGNLIFHPGIFLQCFHDKKNVPINKWLIIDEINRADIDKAFGSLFSALTGDDITLPFDISGEPLKLIGKPKDETKITENQFIIHPHWRIIATMNTFDKTSLYEMSYAFMRRFAFVPIDVPKDINSDLIKKYLAIWGEEIDESICDELSKLWKIINNKRKIGPAIIEDLYKYIKGVSPHDYVSGIIMYVLPQFEGLLEETQIEIIKKVASLHFITAPDVLIRFTSDFFGLDEKKFD